jgi:hypothetical protein
MPTYAATTAVSAEQSRGEIERTLRRYGASSFMYGWDEGQGVLGFSLGNRQVRFVLPLPDKADRAFTLTPTKQRRAPKAAEQAYEQAIRQRWRALALVIKAKLEAVEAGIVSVDEEFLAHFVLPNGSTVGEQVIPEVERAYNLPGVTPLLALTGTRSDN